MRIDMRVSHSNGENRFLGDVAGALRRMQALLPRAPPRSANVPKEIVCPLLLPLPLFALPFLFLLFLLLFLLLRLLLLSLLLLLLSPLFIFPPLFLHLHFLLLLLLSLARVVESMYTLGLTKRCDCLYSLPLSTPPQLPFASFNLHPLRSHLPSSRRARRHMWQRK